MVPQPTPRGSSCLAAKARSPANRMAGRNARARSPVEVKRLLDGAASGLKYQFWARRWGGCIFAAGSTEPSIEVRSGSKSDIDLRLDYVCLTPKNGHRSALRDVR